LYENTSFSFAQANMFYGRHSAAKIMRMWSAWIGENRFLNSSAKKNLSVHIFLFWLSQM
jgi:hypothetical protein